MDPRDQTSILGVGNSGNIQAKQALLEDQENPLQRWEDSDDQHNGVRATLPYCSQCDSASLFGQPSPTSHFR